MAHERVVQAEALTSEAFALFGRVIQTPTEPPTRSGPGWQAWYGYAALECNQPLVFGSVMTEFRAVVVDMMERHNHTFELLYPHDHELIQPLASPKDLDDPESRPHPEAIRAFRIPPGSAIVMHPGTWHSPAFPLSRDCTYTFAVLEPSFPYLPEWIPLIDGATVQVVR
jgi:ureidoglycolate lyase